MPCVTRGVLGELGDPAVERFQVPRNVAETCPRRRPEEARMNQRVATRPKLGREPRMGSRQQGDPPAERVMLGCNRRQKPECTLGDRRQPRACALDLIGERSFGARQRVVADEGTVADREHDIGEQAIGWNGRFELQRCLRKSGATLFQLSDGVPQREADQADDAGAHRCVRRLARVVQSDRHGLAVIDERRVSGDSSAVDHARQRFWQIAKIPAPQPAPLHRRSGIRERQLRRFAELRAQRSEVAPASELVAGRVDHAHVDEKVRGEHDRVPQIFWLRLAETNREPRAQRVGKGGLSRRRRLEERGHGVGQRREPVARSLRQCFQEQQDLFADHARHEPRQS